MKRLKVLFLALLITTLVLPGCKQIQDSLLYHPVPFRGTPPSLPPGWSVDALSVTRSDNIELRGWLAKPARQPAPLLIYFGGNAEEVSWQLADVHRLGEHAVALINYRGYGKSTGSPSQTALFGDALAVHDALVQRPDIDRSRVAVMGRSLGTGVAVHVAANRPVDRAVLISPYDSIEAVAGAHFPTWLVRAVLSDRYDSAGPAPTIRAPMLAIVAARDEVIPVERSQRLHALWGGPKVWVELPGARHNDVQEFPKYWQSIAKFLAER